MVICTTVVPEPAAIFVGSACPVLKAQARVESLGELGLEKEQAPANVTSAANVADPIGVAVNVYTWDVCPASTVCDFGKPAAHVKSGEITVTVDAVAVVDDKL
jgi:hypothetical protein